jgi:hypothetical protein
MSNVPFLITESSDTSDQKFGIGLNTYLRSPRLRRNAKIGSKNTVPPILKIAKACTLFVAKELTSNAQNGVKSANKIAVGTYAAYENCIPSISPDKGGKSSKTMKAKSDMKNIRDIR